jgi:hypothetical protein
MSYKKITQFLRLATFAASRDRGVSLEDIAAAFDCKHRTAQRMVRELEGCFPHVRVNVHDRRKYWAISPKIPQFSAEELTALSRAIAGAETDGEAWEVEALQSLEVRLRGSAAT